MNLLRMFKCWINFSLIFTVFFLLLYYLLSRWMTDEDDMGVKFLACLGSSWAGIRGCVAWRFTIRKIYETTVIFTIYFWIFSMVFFALCFVSCIVYSLPYIAGKMFLHHNFLIFYTMVLLSSLVPFAFLTKEIADEFNFVVK